MTIEPKYVTFDQAKKLKENGFIMSVGPCFYRGEFFSSSNLLRIKYRNIDKKEIIYAPEHWQVIAWLEEVHGIFIGIDFFFIPGKIWDYEVIKIHATRKLLMDYGFSRRFKTKDEAYSAAFDYILDKII